MFEIGKGHGATSQEVREPQAYNRDLTLRSLRKVLPLLSRVGEHSLSAE